MKKKLITYAILIFIVFGLSWLPLIGSFDYEAALLTVLVGLIAIPLLAPDTPKQTSRSLAISFLSLIFWWIGAGLATLSVAALKGEVCSLSQGLGYQILISFPGCLLASLVWGWCSRLFPWKAARVGIYCLAVLADFGFAIYALYNWPPLIAFGQFFGYFAGSIYDETMDVMQSLVTWRIGTCALCLCLFFAQTPASRLPRKLVFPLLGLGLAVGYHIWLAETGQITAMGRSALKADLWQTAIPEGGEYRVHYVPHTKSRRAMAEEKARILREFSRDYAALEDFFHTRPDNSIDIWMYPSPALKGKHIGAIRTSFARVWKDEIHLIQASPDSTLARHEMAHLFAGSFGLPPLKLAGGFHIPAMGWVEGLAMAAEWPVQTYDLHTWSAAILSRPDVFPSVTPHALMYGFWGLPSRVAYTLAGSWVKWLIDRYGIERIKTLSQGMPGDFSKVLGISFQDAFEAWKKDIRENHSRKRANETVELVYGSASIWSKHCARFTASETSAWYDCLDDPFCAISKVSPSVEPATCASCHGHEPTPGDVERLYQYYLRRGPLDEAESVPKAFQIVTHSVPEGIKPALYGAWRQMAQKKRPDAGYSLEESSAAELRAQIFAMLGELNLSEMKTPVQVLWMERKADMMWHGKFNLQAKFMYDALLSRPLPEGMARRIEIKRQAAQYPDSPVSQAVRLWLTQPEDADALPERFVHAPIISYLDLVDAVYHRDHARAHRAAVRLFLSIDTQDAAARLPNRCWPNLMKTLQWLY